MSVFFPGKTVLHGLKEEFVPPNSDRIEEGQVVIEGEVRLGIAGVILRDSDVEFILLDNGAIVWHHTYFRGLTGRVRLIKLDGKLIWQRGVQKSAEPGSSKPDD